MVPVRSARPGLRHSSRSFNLHPARIAKSRALEARLFVFQNSQCCSLGDFECDSPTTDWTTLPGNDYLAGREGSHLLAEMEFIEEL